MTDEEREFVGFFMGEGTMYIHKANMKTTKGIRANYEPVMKIDLRADDYPLVQWIQKHLKGQVYYRTKYTQARKIVNPNGNTYMQNPVVCWKSSSRENCLYIISLLEKAKIPSVKMRQVPVMKKFLELKKRGKRHGFQGKWFTDEDLKEQEELRQKIKLLKVYTENYGNA